MKCFICDGEGNQIFREKVLNKYTVSYFFCKNCGVIFTEKPFWIEDAYKESITAFDTGIMDRNISNAVVTNYLIKKLFNTNANFLDFAGGYGIFTRMMRDLGYNFLWLDKYSPNLLARGFEYKSEKIELVTAFEIFEHFENPMGEIGDMIKYSKNILFSTLTYDNYIGTDVPSVNWWYYCFDTGQHIVFYSKKTLSYIANYFNLHYRSLNDGMHLYVAEKIDLKYGENRLSKVSRWFNYIKRRRLSLALKDMEKHKKYIL